MEPTPVFETYWQFAAERQSIFFRRVSDPIGPWTNDPILATYRFTNAYRASDRVSQYLIREVQYHPDRPSTPPELFFRTLLFKLFNRVQTWETLEHQLGPLTWETTDLNVVARTLDELMERGERVYSAAYIMPAPRFGHKRKHANHLALLAQMMDDKLPERVRQAPSLRSVYETLAGYSGIGRFLALQYTIDLNYSTLLTHSEDDFVVAGPGALDGIAKCFPHTKEYDAEAVIYQVCDDQERSFAAARLNFSTLYGRRLKPIDCQNLFCEVSKYARIAHPEHLGLSGRTRIKQSYRRDTRPQPTPMYPPRWDLKVGGHETAEPFVPARRDVDLFT